MDPPPASEPLATASIPPRRSADATGSYAACPLVSENSLGQLGQSLMDIRKIPNRTSNSALLQRILTRPAEAKGTAWCDCDENLSSGPARWRSMRY